MDLPDQQPPPSQREPGPVAARSYAVAEVEPLDVDGVRTVAVGTALWVVGFLALLPFFGQLTDVGRGWWLFTCLAGTGLGLVGVEYCRRRRAQRLAADEPQVDAG